MDKVAIIEYDSIHRINIYKAKRHFPYTYFGDILILCIIKFFCHNLELLSKSTNKFDKEKNERTI